MAKRKGDEKTRARLEILNYVTNFCLTKIYDEGERKRSFGGIHGFRCRLSDDQAQPGDLIALASAPTSKWHLSWLLEVDRSNPGWPRYLLESIHDGELMWWHNVGVHYLERDEVAAHPSWRWTDDHFAFFDRWWRACYKTRDAYIVLPVYPEFHPMGSVTLGTRVRFSLGDAPPAKTFPNWREVKVRDMLAYYDEAKSWHEAQSAEKRAAREAAARADDSPDDSRPQA
jgi:hypothetical protein